MVSDTTLYAGYTVADVDDNVYGTVLIGNQRWMVENLKTTRLNDRTAIQNVTNNTEWANLETPGYCWYDNDEDTYKEPYGALYNWYVVETGNLAPAGWHIPSDAVLMPDAPHSSSSASQAKKEWQDDTIMQQYRESNLNSYNRYKEGSWDNGSGAGSIGYDTFEVLASLFIYVRNNPKNLVLITGHTDTSGDDPANFSLSKLRAESVYFLLTADKENWVSVCRQRSKVEDYQQILRYVNVQYDWDCDPGLIDNKHGNRTDAAVSNFQNRYNSEYNQSIIVDGRVGLQTWGAVFDVYRTRLAECLRIGQTSSTFPSLPFYQRCSIIACGEKFPVDQAEKDHYRSQKNRRVEILVFKQQYCPDLSCVNTSTGFCRNDCTRDTCIIYNPKAYRYTSIDPGMTGDMTTASTEDTVVIRECEAGPEPFFSQGYEDDDCDIDYGSDDAGEDPWAFFETFGEHDPAPLSRGNTEGRHEGRRVS